GAAHRPGARESVVRHRNHRAGNRLVDIADIRDVDVIDDGYVGDMGDVDLPDVDFADVVGGAIDLVWAEREPCGHAHSAANGHADAEARPADEGNQGRGIDRAHAHDHAAGNPDPTPADHGPAAVVEGREAPRGVIDPGPAPRLDPGPVAVAVRRPTRG